MGVAPTVAMGLLSNGYISNLACSITNFVPILVDKSAQSITLSALLKVKMWVTVYYKWIGLYCLYYFLNYFKICFSSDIDYLNCFTDKTSQDIK